MPEAFWLAEYSKKSALEDPIAQSGRGAQFQPVEFLHVVRQAVELLAVDRRHDLLDVGCANGLLDIVLAACARSVLGIEPVPQLVDKARENLAGCGNARVEVGHGAAVPAPDGSFDRVLVWGVVQLVPPDEARAMLAELWRVTRPGARILLGSVPDARHRDAFLERYLEGVRRATHLSDEQRAAIVERNTKAWWYDASQLEAWWADLGGASEVLPIADRDPNAQQRFHLLATRPGV